MKQLKFKTTKKGSKKYEYQEHIWNLDEQLDLDVVLSKPDFSEFSHCGTVVKSDNAAGFEIKLTEKFINQPFVIYIVTQQGKVLKGGKSKNPLNTRSYSAGTEESWTMRGTPSDTNYVWSQIFRQSLIDGNEIKFYGFIVPSYEYTYPSFDGTLITERVSPYESEEKKLNHLLNKMNKKKVIGEGKLLVQNKK